VSKKKLTEEELRDWESLERAFGTELREATRKGKININMARLAVQKYEFLVGTLRKIGIEIPTDDYWPKWEEKRKDERSWVDNREEVGESSSRASEKCEKRQSIRERTNDDGERDEASISEGYVGESSQTERRRWNDAEAQGDRNWTWKQSEKQRVEHLKEAFLQRKNEREENEKWDCKGREEKEMEDLHLDREDLPIYETQLSAEQEEEELPGYERKLWDNQG